MGSAAVDPVQFGVLTAGQLLCARGSYCVCGAAIVCAGQLLCARGSYCVRGAATVCAGQLLCVREVLHKLLRAGASCRVRTLSPNVTV